VFGTLIPVNILDNVLKLNFCGNITLSSTQLSVSSFFLWNECKSSSPPRMTKEWRSVRLYLVPSIIYLIHNNVQFATLTYVDPSTYQIMGNLKIVTTGILFRYVTCLFTKIFIIFCFLTLFTKVQKIATRCARARAWKKSNRE